MTHEIVATATVHGVELPGDMIGTTVRADENKSYLEASMQQAVATESYSRNVQGQCCYADN
jgi:hypothetical protein